MNPQDLEELLRVMEQYNCDYLEFQDVKIKCRPVSPPPVTNSLPDHLKAPVPYLHSGVKAPDIAMRKQVFRGD